MVAPWGRHATPMAGDDITSFGVLPLELCPPASASRPPPPSSVRRRVHFSVGAERAPARRNDDRVRDFREHGHEYVGSGGGVLAWEAETGEQLDLGDRARGTRRSHRARGTGDL